MGAAASINIPADAEAAETIIEPPHPMVTAELYWMQEFNWREVHHHYTGDRIRHIVLEAIASAEGAGTGPERLSTAYDFEVWPFDRRFGRSIHASSSVRPRS